MTQPLLAPGVYSSEEQTAPVTIPANSETAIAIIGLAEMGPVDVATEVRGDVDDFIRIFGGYRTWCLASIATVRKAFEDGASVVYFTRTCHHSDVTDPATATCAKGTRTINTSTLLAGSGTVLGSIAAPYNLEPGDTIIVDRDALGQATATFNATAATRTGSNGPFALTNGQTLLVAFDGGAAQTVTFTTSQFVSIGAATAAEVAAAINGVVTGGRASVSGSAVKLDSDRRGTGSGVNVSGGTANGALGFTTGNVAGTGNVSNIDAVTSAEVKTVVEAAVSGVTVTNESGQQRITSNTSGGSSMVQVVATSTADDELGLDNAVHTGYAAGAQGTLRVDAKWPGSYAAELRPLVAAPSNGVTGFFNLSIQRNGVTVESFANLTMDATSDRYVETIVNNAETGSRLVVVDDLAAPVAYPNNAPATGLAAALSGGSDGLGSLDDNDFVGGSSANGRVGLRTFDVIRPDLLSCPERATPVMHNAMVTYCAVNMDGKCNPVLDPPAGYSDEQIKTYFETTAALKGLSEHCFFYWPRIKVANPNKAIFGQDDLVTIPPSGMVMGLAARVAQAKAGGQFDQPAGSAAPYRPRNVLGLETKLVNEKPVRNKLSTLGINCIRNSGFNGPVFIDGSNNALQTGSWPSVGQRIGISWARKQIDTFLEAYVHRGITDILLRDQKTTVEEFLKAITDGGALASSKYSEAFFVDFGAGLNRASTKRAKTTRGRVGIATAYPNQFIVISVGPDNRALEAELASGE